MKLSRHVSTAAFLAILLAQGAPATLSAETLKYYGYAGNEKSEFYQAYFDKHGAVDFSISGSSEEMKQKIISGFPSDVVNPCINVQYYTLADGGYLLPLDYGKIPNASGILPSMQGLASYKAGDGKVYYVPREHGSNVWVYLRDKFPDKPASAVDFLDDKHKGRIALLTSAEDVLWLAGKAAGIDVWQTEKFTPEQIEKFKQAFAKMLTNARLLVSSSAEAVQALASGEVDAVYMYNDGASLMKKEGLDVVVQNDAAEGYFAWQCGLAIPKGHQAPLEQIYDYINAVLDADAQAKLLKANGLFVVNEAAYSRMSPEELDTLGLDSSNPTAAFSHFQIHAAGNQQNLDQLIKLWEALKAQR